MKQNHHHHQPQLLQQQQQQHKKQVRRRLHTTRPYQERLVNMAEARREIVTALKFHRAAMKQQAEQKQQQQQRQPQDFYSAIPSPHFQQDFGEFPKIGSVNCPLSYSSCTYQPPQAHLNCPVSPISPLPAADILNFVLPSQPLGLNLNLQDFDNINTTLYLNFNHQLSIYSTDSSPSSSSNANPQSDSGSFNDGGAGKQHVAMDDEVMAEMRSIGEQHQIEWNDNMSLATSAWWFNFLKDMDMGPHQVGDSEDCGNYQLFGQAVELEFPAWLNSSDNCSQQQFEDCCLSQDYFQNTALPW
ncbi:hypothetical protein MLD38_005884 [Melastoma candidum]|uniref:Uncharacterized protein n=1 Tax=Melastoma candidum TaxID=119954 RepID=A0ACB9RMC3_9MYRT|nr:hypothetical protein MLD38_005884 [Melastoma candidum]